MEAEKTKKARKPRKQPKVHVEVVGSWQDRPAYERFQHWKPHIENMYHMLGYGDVTVEPSQEMIVCFFVFLLTFSPLFNIIRLTPYTITKER